MIYLLRYSDKEVGLRDFKGFGCYPWEIILKSILVQQCYIKEMSLNTAG